MARGTIRVAINGQAGEDDRTPPKEITSMDGNESLITISDKAASKLREIMAEEHIFE